MVFRLGILGSPTGPYVRDLIRAADECSVETRLIGFPELQTSIAWAEAKTGGEEEVEIGRGAEDGLSPVSLNRRAAQVAPPVFQRAQVQELSGSVPEMDAVIVRTMPLGSLEQVIFRMDCLHVWQSGGIQVINSPRCLETSIDKWLTLHRLAEAGIPVPPTIACQTREQAMTAFQLLGGDVLVKPMFGGEGRGIIRLHDPDLAWRTLSTLQQLGHVLYMQQFIDNYGYDIRVLLIGDELLSIRRQASEGCYRTNVSLGGTAHSHQLTEPQREMAIRAASAVGGSVVGVDLLPAKDGRLFALEVNAVPGWKGLATCLSVDVAKKFVQYAMRASQN